MRTLRKSIDSEKFITLFADASFCNDTKAYGWGVWIKYGVPPATLVISGGGIGIKDSNSAEVEALKAGIREALRLNVVGKILVIQSDCTGALTIVMRECGKQMSKSGLRNFYTKHVKGHQGHKTPRNSVNTLCDQLARKEMYEQRAKQIASRITEADSI